MENLKRQTNKIKGKGFGYGIVNKESEYTNTISARYYKDGSEILIEQEGKNPRKVTPREAARLQGFPDDFKILVSDTQAYRQFGNSVPVNVIEKIATEIGLSFEYHPLTFENMNAENIEKQMAFIKESESPPIRVMNITDSKISRPGIENGR